MKGFLRAIFASLLAILARAILVRYRPRIIMITGSVGKTSTKDAIAATLAPFGTLRASEKSYNSEFGVPLTIIGSKNPWANPLAWLLVWKRALGLIYFKQEYPRTLVLEVGADRPGDLARILRIATPDAVVVTRLPEVPVHVEAYATPRAVREEEFAPAYALADGAPLIVSSLDTHAIEMAKDTRARVTTVGFGPHADIRIDEPTLLLKGGKPAGMQATVTIQGTHHPLVVSGALGKPQVLAPGAALALAAALGLNLEKALAGLKHYQPPPGRARLLAGVRGSTLIDDSYNASPAATEEALHALMLVPASRRIAVLGDMLELGRYSKSEHERIGTLAAESVDVLIAVGKRARAMCDAARAAGMPEGKTHCFDTSEHAAEYLLRAVEEGDAILVKGSQSIRTERIVEALLANAKDTALLVRQEREWKKR